MFFEMCQTKTAFRKLLLDQGGIHAEDALIDAIFDQVRILNVEDQRFYVVYVNL